jgi:hypothetical protein
MMTVTTTIVDCEEEMHQVEVGDVKEDEKSSSEEEDNKEETGDEIEEGKDSNDGDDEGNSANEHSTEEDESDSEKKLPAAPCNSTEELQLKRMKVTVRICYLLHHQ